MRILAALYLLSMSYGCITNSSEPNGPLFASATKKAKPTKGFSDSDIEDPALVALPNESAGYEEFSVEPDGTINFETDIVYFAYDTNILTPKAMLQLQALAGYLQERPGVELRINGHADERGSTEYNLALGLQRSAAVKRYLAGLGVPSDRLGIISYGEEMPRAEGHNELAWSQNRRVDFKVKSH